MPGTRPEPHTGSCRRILRNVALDIASIAPLRAPSRECLPRAEGAGGG